MAIECPTGNDKYLTDLDVRIWLRDNDPSANLLLNDYEFNAEEMRTAMTLAVDKYNDTPPYLQNHTVETFPYRSALLTGTCANLLFIAANRYRRNDLQYEIGGGSVKDQARHQEYDAAGQTMWTQYLQWIQHNKRALNMEQGWGMIDGGMSWIR